MTPYLPCTFLAALLCAVTAPHALVSQTGNDSLAVMRIVNLHSTVTDLQVASSHGNDTIVQNLGFPSVSQRIEYSGTVTDTLAFTATAPERRLLGRQALTFVPGRYYSVLVLPIGSQALIQSYYRDNRIQVPQEMTYVQFLHGAADVPALSISLTDAKGKATAFTIAGFGTLTAYDTAIAPGAFEITIKALSDERMIFEGKGVLQSGAFQTLVLSGLESTSNVALGIFDQDDPARQDPVRPVERTSMSVLSSEGFGREGVTVSVSPNPVSTGGTIFLSMREAETVFIELYDLRGERVRTVFHGSLPSGESCVDMGSLPGLAGGLYVLKVSSLEGRTLGVVRVLLTA